MRRKTGCAIAALILVLAVLGIHIFNIASPDNEASREISNNERVDQNHIEQHEPDFEESFLVSEESKLKSLKQQLENRIIIDDFLDPSLWKFTKGQEQTWGNIAILSDGNTSEAYRKFDGFLQLQTYLFLDIEVTGLHNIEWFTLYLMENLSYSSYYECNLLPYLSDGNNSVIINKKEFAIGSGIPNWDQISIVKLAFETADNSTATITLGEISTYDAYPMCSMWFDDGWKTTYTEAFPVMKEKNFNGILSVIGSHVNYPNFCSETELDTMYDTGWDFVNHTYDHPDLTKLDAQEAEYEIASGQNYLSSHGYTRACANFVPPYSATNDSVNDIIIKYAATSRAACSSYNHLPITDPYRIGFMEVTSDTTLAMVKEWIDYAIKYDLWLVLLFHSIESPADVNTKYDINSFREIIGYLDEKRSEIKVVSLSELHGSQLIEPRKEAQPIQQNSYQPNSSGLSLVWEDNFYNETLNEQYWNILNTGPLSNNELQTYQKDNVKVENGYLEISSSVDNGAYFSGAVTTENKQLFKYGKIEIRAKLPTGKGIFPALWMLPQSGDSFPEIDIAEFLGSEPDYIWHVMHYLNNGQQERYYKQVKGNSFNEDFHVFSLQWSDDSLVWMIDGEETYSIKDNIPNSKMFLYINTAIGGNWPGNPDASTVFPQTLLIDYVKYYVSE